MTCWPLRSQDRCYLLLLTSPTLSIGTFGISNYKALPVTSISKSCSVLSKGVTCYLGACEKSESAIVKYESKGVTCYFTLDTSKLTSWRVLPVTLLTFRILTQSPFTHLSKHVTCYLSFKYISKGVTCYFGKMTVASCGVLFNIFHILSQSATCYLRVKKLWFRSLKKNQVPSNTLWFKKGKHVWDIKKRNGKR